MSPLTVVAIVFEFTHFFKARSITKKYRQLSKSTGIGESRSGSVTVRHLLHSFHSRLFHPSLIELDLQLCRVVKSLNLLWVHKPTLLPHLIHDLHNQHTLIKAKEATLFPAVDNSICRLVGFPEHALALAF